MVVRFASYHSDPISSAAIFTLFSVQIPLARGPDSNALEAEARDICHHLHDRYCMVSKLDAVANSCYDVL